MKHALVVGGTGMLKDVCLWLTQEGYHVSIIARRQDKMERLLKEAEDLSLITPIYVDYTEVVELREKLRLSLETNGPISLVVAWIHSTGKKALPVIIDEVTRNSQQWDLFHILGSSSNLSRLKEKTAVPNQCQYHQIQLGFIIHRNQSRWLNDTEISNGVKEAIKEKKQIQMVGTLKPWEKRP